LKIHFGEESIGTVLLPTGAGISWLPSLHLSGEDVRRASHGREVKVAESEWTDGENVRMYDPDEQLIAVGRYDANARSLHPHVVLAGDV